MKTYNGLTLVINKIDEIVNRLSPGSGVMRLNPDEAGEQLSGLTQYTENVILIEALSRSLIIEHMRHMYHQPKPHDGEQT